MRHTTSTQRARRRASGFTLIEILISLGIFLIGMTAIVSLFPAAAILQRETTEEVLANMAAESGSSIIDAQRLTYASPGGGDLGAYHPTLGSTNINSVPLHVLDPTLLTLRFPPADRSFPTGLVDGLDTSNCDLHWVPFIQDLSGDPSAPNWIVRLFIVQSDSRATYTGNPADANPSDPTNFPKVRGVGVSATGDTFTLATGTDIEASDIVMDSNGNDHIVTEVNGNDVTVLFPIPRFPNAPTTLWYAPRGGATNSPAQRVITLEVNVQAP